MRKLLVFVTALAFFSAGTLTGLFAGDSDFAQRIRPILAENCFACHGPDENHREGDLRLDDETAAKDHAIVAGSSAESEVFARITSDDPDLVMPPADSGKSLTQEEIELLRQWIDDGAKWSGHWAFESVAKPAVPDAGADWVRNEIDRFTYQRMATAGLHPSAVAEPEVLVRRLYLDLIGLPPTREQARSFLDDPSDDAYERVVDELLASEHYGERMAVYWLDGARYADTNGFQNDFYRRQWPWRDWVIQAFNDNMPYDQFVTEQLAGDLLPEATDRQRIATGFCRNNHSVTEGGSIEAEWFVENVIDRVETTSNVFLGLTMGCARCHSHKYDPITQKDFYRFFAFFSNVNEKGFYQETRGNVGPQVTLATEEHERQLDEFDRRIAEIEEQAADSGEDMKEELKAVRKERQEYKKTIPTVMVMEDKAEMSPAYLLNRGQYNAPDKSEELWPAVPEFLPAMPQDAPKSRLGLAEWMVSADNPLVSRVMVNRVWANLFGRGIVASLDNFGVQSDPPSHPQLLDWLAADFMDSGWDLKRLQKQLVMSSTYRQSSDRHADGADKDNLLLSRGSRFRLPAEVIRDNALSISGLLRHHIGGPSVRPYQPDGLWMELAGGANDGPYKADGPEGMYRKSLYTYRKRTVSHPTLSTFDAPNWETCTVSRATTNTPLQALALLNDVTYVEAGRKLGERMMQEAEGDVGQRVAWAWTLATCRPPSAQKVDVLTQAFHRYQQHFAANEQATTEYLANGISDVDESLAPADLAAYSLVASTILNLDEVITRE